MEMNSTVTRNIGIALCFIGKPSYISADQSLKLARKLKGMFVIKINGGSFDF